LFRIERAGTDFGVILPQVVKLFEDPATRAPR